ASTAASAVPSQRAPSPAASEHRRAARPVPSRDDTAGGRPAERNERGAKQLASRSGTSAEASSEAQPMGARYGRGARYGAAGRGLGLPRPAPAAGQPVGVGQRPEHSGWPAAPPGAVRLHEADQAADQPAARRRPGPVVLLRPDGGAGRPRPAKRPHPADVRAP